MSRGIDEGVSLHLDVDAFTAAPAISIDHAVMEHTSRGAIVPVSMGWSDIGSWSALYLSQTDDQDANGNVLCGDVLIEDVHGSYVRSNGPLVTALGLDNVIIVAQDDAVLVASADRVGEVGKFVATLHEKRRSEPVHHRRVHRPWGYYQTIDMGERFQVKRIMVKPGGQLSLQMHYHRAEHWVIVSGIAWTECDGETRLLRENESIYIPQGGTHRLENPGKVPLHLIEVQTGTYLGEDDIVRFEDSYGRC